MRLSDLPEDDAPSEPNVAPLIDIVFILLIFFVVTTTFARDLGIDVERPSARSGQAMPDSIVRVAIGPENQLTVDGRATSAWRLKTEVEERLTHYTAKSVLVVADRRVEASSLVEVMDACRMAGATQVALSVEDGP